MCQHSYLVLGPSGGLLHTAGGLHRFYGPAGSPKQHSRTGRSRAVTSRPPDVGRAGSADWGALGPLPPGKGPAASARSPSAVQGDPGAPAPPRPSAWALLARSPGAVGPRPAARRQPLGGCRALRMEAGASGDSRGEVELALAVGQPSRSTPGQGAQPR
eukprot:scaffold1041_cov414-Prasinococcus_capsulatus_cf.AAC.3